MDMHQYVADEIAADCADGLISRREALRRLGLIGVGAVAAGTLLAACGDDDDTATATTPAPARTSTTAGPAGAVQSITVAGQPAVYAAAADPKGAVLIIHEIFGLTDHFRDLPARLADDGYSALTVDLVPGGTAATDQGDVIGRLTGAPPEATLGRLRAGLDELADRVPDAKLGVMGFCFGGGLTWQLLAAGEARVAAAIPFYGPTPDNPDFSDANAAVLAIYGELDSRVNATRDAATAALQAASLTYEVKTFAGADHAFFNDTGPRYNAPAATEAYRAVLDWFGRYLD
jgi:carboxymethylenebutenolidase